MNVDLDQVKAAVRLSEDMDRFGGCFVVASKRLVDKGFLTLEGLAAHHGWTRSVTRHVRRGSVLINVYFTYRMPNSTEVSERVYLDVGADEAWGNDGRQL